MPNRCNTLIFWKSTPALQYQPLRHQNPFLELFNPERGGWAEETTVKDQPNLEQRVLPGSTISCFSGKFLPNKTDWWCSHHYIHALTDWKYKQTPLTATLVRFLIYKGENEFSRIIQWVILLTRNLTNFYHDSNITTLSESYAHLLPTERPGHEKKLGHFPVPNLRTGNFQMPLGEGGAEKQG